MTLERLNRDFYGFFGDFGLQDTFQKRIALKPIEIGTDNLRMKFLALNVDFDGQSLDFLGSRKPAHEGIKERYSRKKSIFYRCWPVFHENSWRQTDSLQTGTAIGFRASREL